MNFRLRVVHAAGTTLLSFDKSPVLGVQTDGLQFRTPHLPSKRMRNASFKLGTDYLGSKSRYLGRPQVK